MGELVLLVVAAAWAAVLIPPLLRSRMENRPNSSVTDFRRQLSKLQSTVPNRASGPMRGMARPLAQSPAYRNGGRGPAGTPVAVARKAGTRSHGERTLTPTPVRRSSADATGQQRRPARAKHARQAHVARHRVSPAEQLRRRRANVLFMLVVASVATLFLAATTKSSATLYLFAISFLALCGYLYLLSQARQRESSSWPTDWMQTERPVARRAYH